jgi:dTDP-4-amino-4,6-dideoxygalactose transaminase
VLDAQPVFVDVRDDYNIDPTLIEQAITPRTKAILPVHLTGRPADMEPILDIAKHYNLHIVEDCAQAVTAEYKGKSVGGFGTIGCFSLHPLKTLNACGDGGVLTTNDTALAERFKILRNIGLKSRNECVTWSGNSRLDNIQAAILLVKLNYLSAWTEKRRANAHFYQRHLVNLQQLKMPNDKPYERSVYHTFVVQTDSRNELKTYLAGYGIETAIHYPVPIHFHKAALKLGYGLGSFPTTERHAQRILSLPIYPELTTNELSYIVESIQKFFKDKT